MYKLKKFIGKYLKKLTLFDLVIISIVLIFLSSFYFLFRREAKYINIRVKISNDDIFNTRNYPSNWFANQFLAGDIDRDAIGRVTAEIIKVDSMQITNQSKSVYLDMRIMTTYDSRSKRFSYKGKPIVYATLLRFELSKIIFDGYVVDFPGNNVRSQSSYKTVTLKKRLIEESLADSIHVGDKIFDSEGNMLVEVLDVSVNPALRVVENPLKGTLYQASDPIYKDLTLTISLRTKTINNEIYAFDDFPVKIDNKLPLNFPQALLDPFILKIK